MTLVEMLISMTVSLIMVYAMLMFFGNLMASVRDGRSAIEISGQLRSTTDRLHKDLRGRTAPVQPWADPAAGLGYFEYIEGRGHDFQPLLGLLGDATWNTDTVPFQTTAFGDIDDVLAFTAYSADRPFMGQFRRMVAGNYQMFSIDSHYAEIVWWTLWDRLAGLPNFLEPGEVLLYRRVLLIRPDLGLVETITGSAANSQQLANDILTFYNFNDISVRPEVIDNGGNITVNFWANSLEDLTKRENRFCHRPIVVNGNVIADSAIPPSEMYLLSFSNTAVPSLATVPKHDEQLGEDVILSHVTAFDVKVYDPDAPLRPNHSTPAMVGELLAPGDPGFDQVATTYVGAGAYVDLGFSDYVASSGFTSALAVNPLPSRAAWNGMAVYDTWPFFYEQDGRDQNGARGADEGTNGIDDDGLAGVDDPGERETTPPYLVPLRGIKVSIRAVDPDSRQVRQLSVISDFTPE